MWVYPALFLAVIAVFLSTAGRMSTPAVSYATNLMLTAEDNLLIFAPHSDDEVLGMGGLISEAVLAGASVKVVLITNGDGFPAAAGRTFKQVRLAPEKYIELAHIRQRESLAALDSLGLASENVIFFGYPDRGIARMWLEHWCETDPFRSSYTRRTVSPYDNSYRLNAPFCGEALAEDITTVIRDLRPDMIFLPHPNDAHPDHWATYNFVLYALEGLRREMQQAMSEVTLYHYIVHQGKWPAPRGWRNQAEILPPRGLARLNTEWVRVELRPETVFAKYKAILAYKSQVSIMFKYLTSFARRNELFALVPIPPVPVVADGTIVVDGKGEDWNGIEAAIWDPAADTLFRRVQRSTDIDRVFVAHDRENLYFRIDQRGRLSRFITYCLHLRLLHGSGEPTGQGREIDIQVRVPGRVTLRLGGERVTTVEGLLCQTSQRTIEIGVPIKYLGNPEKIFFGAETRLGFIHADQTAWQVVSLTGVSP